MELEIGGKVAVVTAASKGIGFAIAKKLYSEGVKLAICSRSEKNILEAARKIGGGGNALFAVPCDVTDYGSIKKFVSEARKRLGPVSILVNNAGGPPAGYFDDFDDDAWFKAFELNFMSAVRMIREVLPDAAPAPTDETPEDRPSVQPPIEPQSGDDPERQHPRTKDRQGEKIGDDAE